jgi:hypothetical protein
MVRHSIKELDAEEGTTYPLIDKQTSEAEAESTRSEEDFGIGEDTGL